MTRQNQPTHDSDIVIPQFFALCYHLRVENELPYAETIYLSDTAKPVTQQTAASTEKPRRFWNVASHFAMKIAGAKPITELLQQSENASLKQSQPHGDGH